MPHLELFDGLNIYINHRISEYSVKKSATYIGVVGTAPRKEKQGTKADNAILCRVQL